jgi:2-polyprenyl-3-methyl-5-hydroxy-6-metoxy-1,4-benzoquinol methylase
MTEPRPDEWNYLDMVRVDILRMIPPDGNLIGTIGCGKGLTESQIIQGQRQVYGVDTSSEAIEVATTRLSKAWQISATEETPFEENSLDGLILSDVLEHMPMAHIRLRHFSKMVKPGGWVVISVPNMLYLEAIYQYLVKGDWPESPVGIFDHTHVQFMTHKRLERWCLGVGLELETWFDCYHYAFYRRNIARAINLASFKLLRGFTNFEIQARFRKTL